MQSRGAGGCPVAIPSACLVSAEAGTKPENQKQRKSDIQAYCCTQPPTLPVCVLLCVLLAVSSQAVKFTDLHLCLNP